MFATRSPFRPNPIAISTVNVINVDYDNGIINIGYIDAYNMSPVVDIKPYIPSIDKVLDVRMPSWCNQWPDFYEKSGDFDWSSVFNFK